MGSFAARLAWTSLGWQAGQVLAQEPVPRGAAADLLRALATAERAEVELLECRKALKVCDKAPANPGDAARVKSTMLVPGSPEAPEWPEGYGGLLRFPFGIADMKTLKEVARELWQPHEIQEEVTALGFRQLHGARCSSEMVGVHPVGSVGSRRSEEIWDAAQQWCHTNAECTGIMLYVGSNTLNCNYWCGRPQFCNGDLEAEGAVEPSSEWNLWVKTEEPDA
ncbi:unnamed protein product [Effrenium voratum]|uniref:Uncharacterized protein n=1 Tax=Effrenium voratum TaxID=2562239 RepID=A0AA36JAC9_9DINO|nr:unnamed protein product [Effrenium voratum]CAJ1413347.1 unnamed protein product [Effrenium voratum]